MDEIQEEQEFLEDNPPAEESAEKAEEKPAEEPTPSPEAEAPEEQPEGEKPSRRKSRADARIQELLERERELREQLAAREAELQAQREAWARLEERQRLLQELQQKQQPQEDPNRPDPSIDPVGAELYDLRKKVQELEGLREQWNQYQQQNAAYSQQLAEANKLNLWLQQDIERVRAEKPDYDDAVRAAYQYRIQLWQNAGYTPEQAQDIVQREALAIAAQARARGKSAAELYYAAGKPLLAQQAPQPAQKTQQPSAAEKLKTIQKGQKFQGLGGRTPGSYYSSVDEISRLRASDIANMSDDEFIRVLNDPKLGPALKARLESLELGEEI
jgi:hypothetical protein